ncbi:LytR C-terminal domain-containing protein [Paeniglutamicibacter sp. NPDC012692]|uniref:LytR C-terminal domain-containing protein n=1 Tax=Paeniglutamicibacter sp. NPDC012692 TaxID=3364388 RepID=UPI00368084B1
MARDSNPNEWHGHHIVSEDELARPEFSADPKTKRHRIIRHGIILSMTVLLLAAALVFAYLVNTRVIVIDALEPKPVAEAPVAPNTACPRDQFDYVDPSKMTINVMNGTQIAGLAGASAKKLEQRGFKVGEVGNARMSKVNVVGAVISGPDGYAQAMTVQRHIAGLTYVFDPKRKGKTVDLVIGTKYKKLVKEPKVNTQPGQLGCNSKKKTTAPAKPEPSKSAKD